MNYGGNCNYFHQDPETFCQGGPILTAFFFFFGGGGLVGEEEDLNTTISGQSWARQGNAI